MLHFKYYLYASLYVPPLSPLLFIDLNNQSTQAFRELQALNVALEAELLLKDREMRENQGDGDKSGFIGLSVLVP